MDNQLIINFAAENDLPEILAVYNEAILNTTAVYQEEPHTLAMRQAWFAEKQKNNQPVFVARYHNGFAGFSTYGPFRNWPGYRFTIEHSVYVSANFRGMGIGKKLVQAVIEHAANNGIHVVIAGIDASAAASIGLHLSLGFEEVAHFREVGYKFNRWLDLKFMELIIK